ncbi:MAG: hypothetical protein RLZZ373_3369 [Pseudomonadota bacterium]|jgi:hypothetical protein
MVTKPDLTVPPTHALAITPADADLVQITRGLYIGTAGDLAVRMGDGTDVTFANVPAGTIMPVRVKRVRAATTADDIVALW